MGGVAVAVVDIVDVVAMGHGNMSATLAVGVVVAIVGRVLSRLTLIEMPVVGAVQVAVVDVVDVVAMGHGNVAATLAVGVVVVVSDVFCMRGRHQWYSMLVITVCCPTFRVIAVR
ncbi:MAG: hypothetical protein ACRDUA_23005 [Micromonosporaceae bacterium]